MLLLNAMRATAAHSSMAFASSLFTPVTESVPPETPDTARARSSVTPAPAGSRGATPKVPANPPTQQEPTHKAAPGAGRKKRKRAFS